MLDVHIHTMMFNCLTFHNFRVAQWEITPELQQMYGLFHAQLCFDMGFTTLRDMGLQTYRGLLVREACAIRDAIDMGIVDGPRMMIAAFTTITGSHLDLIQPRAAERLGFQKCRRAVGIAASFAAHQSPARRGRDQQDMRVGRRRHRQGRAGHPQHDAGRA